MDRDTRVQCSAFRTQAYGPLSRGDIIKFLWESRYACPVILNDGACPALFAGDRDTRVIIFKNSTG
jgi:hypothetical protein